MLCTDYGLKYHKSRTVYGALMGAGLFLTVLALETAIFWGEYSKCSPGKSLADLYNNECSNTSAMISACVFAVFMFLTLLVQLVLLFMYRDAILGTGPLNEGLGVGASASNKQQPAAGPYSSVGQAADDDTVSVTFDGSSQSHNQSHNSNRGQHLTSVDL